jgi:hypothetical protein
MTFKIMAAAVAVIVVAAANCGCSAVPPGLQASGQVTPGRVSYAASGANGYGPAVDLGGCAHSPAPPTRIDQLCNRQDGNPF